VLARALHVGLLIPRPARLESLHRQHLNSTSGREPEFSQKLSAIVILESLAKSPTHPS
jgi:hypothetical protein